MRAAAPEARLVVWCNEDTPLIWPEILRAMGAMPDSMEIRGLNDFLGTIMSAEGVQRMESYLATHPVKTPAQRQRVVTAFLDKYALADELVMELDQPGWTTELVERLTANYLDDCATIAAMQGVTFLAP